MIRLQDSYWQPIHAEIQNFLWTELFDPIFNILAIRKPFQNAYLGNLEQAIADGRVHYGNGVFSAPDGRFGIKVLRELSEFATYERYSRTWIGLPPPPIIATAARVKFESQRINERVAEVLPKFEANFEEALKGLTFPIVHVISAMNEGLQQSLGTLAILPELTPEAYANLIGFYHDQQRLNIQNWEPEQISRLRNVIEANVKAGYNRQELETMIRQEWEVSANKARFLARQETSLFVSRFRDERYQSAGIEEYIWMSSGDSRCRGANKHGGPAHGPGGPLHGHKFRFDDPPVSGTRGERENPGVPFGCRCIARPVLKGA